MLFLLFLCIFSLNLLNTANAQSKVLLINHEPNIICEKDNDQRNGTINGVDYIFFQSLKINPFFVDRDLLKEANLTFITPSYECITSDILINTINDPDVLCGITTMQIPAQLYKNPNILITQPYASLGLSLMTKVQKNDQWAFYKIITTDVPAGWILVGVLILAPIFKWLEGNIYVLSEYMFHEIAQISLNGSIVKYNGPARIINLVRLYVSVILIIVYKAGFMAYYGLNTPQIKLNSINDISDKTIVTLSQYTDYFEYMGANVIEAKLESPNDIYEILHFESESEETFSGVIANDELLQLTQKIYDDLIIVQSNIISNDLSIIFSSTRVNTSFADLFSKTILSMVEKYTYNQRLKDYTHTNYEIRETASMDDLLTRKFSILDFGLLGASYIIIISIAGIIALTNVYLLRRRMQRRKISLMKIFRNVRNSNLTTAADKKENLFRLKTFERIMTSGPGDNSKKENPTNLFTIQNIESFSPKAAKSPENALVKKVTITNKTDDALPTNVPIKQMMSNRLDTIAQGNTPKHSILSNFTNGSSAKLAKKKSLKVDSVFNSKSRIQLQKATVILEKNEGLSIPHLNGTKPLKVSNMDESMLYKNSIIHNMLKSNGGLVYNKSKIIRLLIKAKEINYQMEILKTTKTLGKTRFTTVALADNDTKHHLKSQTRGDRHPSKGFFYNILNSSRYIKDETLYSVRKKIEKDLLHGLKELIKKNRDEVYRNIKKHVKDVQSNFDQILKRCPENYSNTFSRKDIPTSIPKN